MSEQNGFTSEAKLFGGEIKRRYKSIVLPISGHRVRIQSLTEREMSRYQAVVLSKRGNLGAYNFERLMDANRRLIVASIVDQAGNRILNESHLTKLAEWDAADTQHLYNECAAHCGISREDIEGLVKKSEAITVDDSPSGSPNG